MPSNPQDPLAAALGSLILLTAALLLLALTSLALRRPPPTPAFTRRPPPGDGALRPDPNAGFLTDRGLLFLPRRFFLATGCPPVRVRPRAHAALDRARRTRPVRIVQRGRTCWWWFEDAVYAESRGYRPADVLARVVAERVRGEALAERTLLLTSLNPRHPRIPAEVRRAVFERDRGRCAHCGGTTSLNYDHVVPLAEGGPSTVGNLRVLCRPCLRTAH
ncbi:MULTISPECIES: HNH endonuclease [Actinosynnema]|uniref:HNH endonuclease n=1 Tax=Actinosynnema TaxID=40566 RepID=UPI0020A33C4D|nr:HNH endonuclease signature motif containing protein [Actinosynnema pretiosum]MCP2099833.1 5-methylcytosine-specific restriction endonuclease McrA [Actinosynnema pretiosum]